MPGAALLPPKFLARELTSELLGAGNGGPLGESLPVSELGMVGRGALAPPGLGRGGSPGEDMGSYVTVQDC